jgi:type VI secretion system ImpA family protein/type VI secretion system ImpA/VasJ family protein
MPESAPLDITQYLVPIREDEPAGESLQYDDEYDKIQNARVEEALTDIDEESKKWAKKNPKRANWDVVISVGLDALKKKSKDIQIAAWVTEALTRQKGLVGLRDGLRLILAIQDKFWNTAHPGEGDPEVREGIYDFLDDQRRLPFLIRETPLVDVKGKPAYSFYDYEASRKLENDLLKESDSRERDQLLAGKLRAEDFDLLVKATDRDFYVSTITILDECLEATQQLNTSLRSGTDLRLMSSVQDVDRIPDEGENLVIVAEVKKVLHFRIFDLKGKRILDTDESRLTDQTLPIESLKKEIAGLLWPPRDLSLIERDRVIAAVRSIVGLPSPTPQHYGRKGPALTRTFTALEAVASLAKELLEEKPAPLPDPVDEADPVEDGSSGEISTIDESQTAEPLPPPPQPSRRASPPTRQMSPSTGGPISSPEEARARIALAANFLREADPADPVPYLLVRALSMGLLYRSPGVTGTTTFDAPATESRQELRRLLSEGSWPELLTATEQILSRPEGAGWIDVRRLALQALESIGHNDALRASKAILGAELRDYPEWPRAELNDETACAGRETLSWIAEAFPADSRPNHTEVSRDIQSALDDESPPIENGSRPPDPWDQALALHQEGRIAEAISLLGRASREAKTGRERFLRTFQQAELCLRMGRPGVATPLLEGLARQIDEFQLERWEDPGLCARVVAALYRCVRGKDEIRARTIYDRLCQLDIGQALSIDEESDR